MTMEFRFVHKEGHETITAFIEDEPYTVTDTHPNYAQIRESLLEGSSDPHEIRDLLDTSGAVQRHFDKVSDRVSIKNGTVYLDYDPIDSSLSRTILRFYQDGLDFSPLVNFFEKVQSNPSTHSREQLFDWLREHEFTITGDGDFLAYKSVKRRGDGYVSVNSGRAIVNGQEHEGGPVPNPIGAIVELPRAEVAFDPTQGCAFGLHAGTWRYVTQDFNHDAVLKVKINPRDVVSVPTDSNWEKLRVCRYLVLEETSKEVKTPIYEQPSFEDDEFTNSSKLRNEFEEDDFVPDDEKDVGDDTPLEELDAPSAEELSQPDGDEFEEKSDIPVIGATQQIVLATLYDNLSDDRLKIKEVAAAANISRDAAKNALYRLVDKGLAEFGESHRLAKTFDITGEGEELVEYLRYEA